MQKETTTARRAVLPWIGGKCNLAGRIIPLMPEHRCYCEVFAGAAWLLFKKPESRLEILNDINMDLVTLYRVIKHHLDEFIRYLRWMVTARDEFERFKAMRADTMTDVQRAVRFYYLHRNAFAPGIPSPAFRIDTTHRPRFNLLRIEEDLSATHLRLQNVFIENRPYDDVVRRFDRPHTLFYLDPPYYGCENYYGKGIFSRADFAKLAELLAGIKGKFIMSINDRSEIRKLYQAFNIRRVSTRYSVGQARQKPVHELLITNYKTRRTAGL